VQITSKFITEPDTLAETLATRPATPLLYCT